ncbi:hypothetical protein BTO04_14850 [Polaribacter sp. SA4-10]|nr:hypothetical protein BTO04_14850 [Polaribacter sp. SA4-10]
MLKSKLSVLLITISSLICVNNVQAQLSKKHFIPPLTYAENGNANPENQYFYISTPSNKSVSYTIKQIGLTGGDITGFVSSTSPEEIFIGNGDSQLFVDSRQTSVVHTNKGYIIEADDAIYVSIRVLAGGGAQAGALVSKGASALGTTFRAGMFTNENPQDNYLNFISVMATENNTLVNFEDLPTGILIKNYSGTLPISNILLNEGESYVVATNAAENIVNRDGLIGTLITSNKDIVTNVGSANGSFHSGGGRDYGIDQIVGIDKVTVINKAGAEYIFVKGDGSNGWENVLIVAHKNNTTININGNGVIATIDKGEYHLIEGNEYNANGNLYVETSKPVFAYQGIGANTSEANQGLFFVPPLSCENRGKVDNIPTIENIGNVEFTGGITIVTNKGATVNINSQPISNFTTSGPFNVDGNTEYVTYKVTNLTGDISIESSDELYCAYFNQNGAASSGSFYSGFPSSPEINFDATVSTLGNCIPNLTLEAANTELFDEFEWFFDDETGGGFISTGNTNSTFTPTNPGKYQLVGKIICSGTTFKSTEVPVSICPDDYDGDTIIDNLDSDIDNDGILNCDESIGNATLNIANINNPSIVFQDSSTNNSTTSIYTENEISNTFSGDNTGNFESVINPATGTKLKYELKFTQNVNFKFTQNKNVDHTITDGEYFIIKIGPNNKNITLLDTDDQLLVNTSFDIDQEFEAGITSISAAEIWFKYKANTTGAASTFQFIANQVDHIDFKHQSTGISTTSTFNGNIQLTCFSLNSDGDGIENMFDLDSDNDGIPDFYESAIDTDSDGILNYLDLDSDNDGIFDATEAGHNLDTDFDGLVDNANSSAGINGLADNLETVPDAKALSINYKVANTDNDNDFNFVEPDADDDDCNDVIEAGFTDQNNDGFLGNLPIEIDENGKVINTTDGYTNPNINYTTSAPILLNTPFEDVIFCEGTTDNITIDATADSFQWQVSTDSSTWNNITDNTTYNGTTSNTLQITNVLLSYNNYQFRVLLNRIGNGCGDTSNAITLNANPAPVVTNVDLLQCDDDLDRISTVNLTEAEISISTNNQNETFEYFETEANAIAGTPEVNDKLRYPVNQNGEAWARTISSEGCYTISKINLEVEAAADVDYNEEFPEVCDDFLQEDGTNGPLNNDTDGITNFDFSNANNEILAFFPLALQPDLEISYFETTEDRTAVINKITDISNYRNIGYPSNITRQTIYFKITNKNNNNCNGTGELSLKTNSVPIANPVSDLELCDNANDGNGTNGIVQNFNLENQTNTISADFSVTYHDSAANANSGNNALTSPYENTVKDSQTIYVRVTNTTTNCFTDHTTFNLVVNPIPIANFVQDLEICDDNSDGSARNGFSQSFDLESQSDAILGTQNKSLFTVTYHRDLNDAQNGISPLVSPFSNTKPDIQTIYVRVYNSNTTCANGISQFDVIVNSEPLFEPISNLSYCDDDLDDDDTNGIIQNIDLEGQIPSILGTTQDPDDFKVTFHENQDDAISGNTPLLSPYTNTNPTETIFVRIQNKATSCVNDDATFDVIVNPLPNFTVTTPQVICLNNLPLNISVENPSDIYTYQWKDLSGNIISTSDNVDITNGGNYTVTATTTNGTNCTKLETIVVDESNPATLNERFITIIDESNNIGSTNTISISIATTNNNLGLGDYQFAVRNDDNNERIPFIGFQKAPLFENLEGGIYTIIVNDKKGCSPDAELQISVIQFPKFFTPNGDGKNDTWVIKGANKTFYPNSSINIFNRFGKLMAQVPIDSQGWNGTFNGKTLPSDDYWFNIQLIPADTSKYPILKKGHFSLLRK